MIQILIESSIEGLEPRVSALPSGNPVTDFFEAMGPGIEAITLHHRDADGTVGTTKYSLVSVGYGYSEPLPGTIGGSD